jgi:hypothetical protein
VGPGHAVFRIAEGEAREVNCLWQLDVVDVAQVVAERGVDLGLASRHERPELECVVAIAQLPHFDRQQNQRRMDALDLVAREVGAGKGYKPASANGPQSRILVPLCSQHHRNARIAKKRGRS